MAGASVTIRESEDSTICGANPMLGNYTDDAAQHLWCAQALASVLAAPEIPIMSFNSDTKSALLYLLRSEILRAQKAAGA